MKNVKIGNHEIGMGTAPFIVAEMSGNHNQSIERAFKIVDAAAEAGAHAVKLQTYTADTMTLNIDSDDFRINDKSSLWAGRNLHQLYAEAHTPWEWHKPIMERCRERGMLCFSTPFDETAVDFLEDLNVPCYKIASFENTDLPLVRKVAQTKKPVIISTGMATLSELEDVVTTARNAGIEDLILLKCTSAYPAPYSEVNLRTIPHLSQMFNCPVGLSDHTMGIAVPVAAVALGASFVEKHFTLSREDGGVDSAFSLNPDELTSLVCETKNIWHALGQVSYGRTQREEKSLAYRRSLYITKDMKAGEIITDSHVRCVRPGYGLAPKHLDTILGRTINRDLVAGTPVKWELFE